MKMLQIAQVNIAHMRGALEDTVMEGFVARLAEINALADGSPGFVWRLQSPEGNATYLRPYDDDRILFNLSVYQTSQRWSAGRTIGVPGLQENAFWNSGRLETGPMTRNFPIGCGSP